MTTAKITEGVIDSYNESRGFGLISSASQPRIFFHVSSVVGQKKPVQGLRVTFSTEASPKGPRAVRVVVAER
jgi:cold shock CspA family protein